MDAVVPRGFSGVGVHAAARYDCDVGIFSDIKIIVDQIVYIAVRDTGGNGHRFSQCAGSDADLQPRLICFGFDFNMRAGLPSCAAAVLPEIVCACKNAVVSGYLAK